jgi:hypothetical protein
MRPIAKISSTKSNRKSGFTLGVNTYGLTLLSYPRPLHLQFSSTFTQPNNYQYLMYNIYIYIYIYIYTYIIQKTHRALIFSSKHSPTGCIPRIFLPTIDTVVHSHSITVSPPSPGYESTRTGPRTNLKHTTIG